MLSPYTELVTNSPMKPFETPHHEWQHWSHRRWKHRPRFLFMRLAGFFGLITLFILATMGGVALLLTRGFGGDGRTAVLVWLTGCGLAFTFPVLAVATAVRAFRNIASPLSHIMTAADAVAEGDLNVRVPENGRGEFGQLARTFNHMTEELQRADQQRRNLTADVAHELRTPLHIIQGNLEGVLDGVYEPTPEHLQATLEETRQLARLVEDLRTLSLAETGQLPLVWEETNIADLLQDIYTSFSGQAETADIELKVEIVGERQTLTVTADAGRLDQVFSNLTVNALRHTPAGGQIVLKVKPTDGYIRITVQDSGVGISPEDLPYIFDRFWRGDRSRSHTGGAGAGLGLAIARQLIHAHNGRISAQSAPDQGTIFMVELPQSSKMEIRD